VASAGCGRNISDTKLRLAARHAAGLRLSRVPEQLNWRAFSYRLKGGTEVMRRTRDAASGVRWDDAITPKPAVWSCALPFSACCGHRSHGRLFGARITGNRSEIRETHELLLPSTTPRS